jgi:hypothetical protein
MKNDECNGGMREWGDGEKEDGLMDEWNIGCN